MIIVQVLFTTLIRQLLLLYKKWGRNPPMLIIKFWRNKMASKRNVGKVQAGRTLDDMFSFTTNVSLIEVMPFGANGVEFGLAVYYGTSAITLANYAGLPKGYIIIDTQAYKIHMKVAAAGTSTWKSSAAMS